MQAWPRKDAACLVGLSAAQQPAQVQLLRLERRLPQAALQEKRWRPILALRKETLLPRCWDWLDCLLTVNKGRSHCWGLSCQTCSWAMMERGWPQLQYPAK